VSEDALVIHRVAGGTMANRAVTILAEAIAGSDQPTQLAVLARVNSALLPVQVALTEAGIPHTAPLDTAVLQRTGVRTALAYLRLALDTDRLRRDDVFDTLNRPARKVKSAVTPHLPRGGRWSLGALEQVCDQLDGTHRERFAGYLDDLRHLEAAITDGADTARCLWVVRNRIGLGEAMDALDASRRRPEGSSHGDDLDALEQLATLQPDPAAFADWLAERLQVPGEPTGVTLSTVHRVKGMEWPTVVVFAANQGLFPHRLADDEEEERRVFHVAITRCQRAVHVVCDRSRPSPFVDELDPAMATAPADGHDGEVGGRPRRPRPTAGDTPDDGPVGGGTLPGGQDEVEATAPTFLPDGRLHAAVGVDVTLAGDLRGRICGLGRHHVIVQVRDEHELVTFRLPLGANVQIAGTDTVLGPPPRAAGRSEGGGPGGRRAGVPGQLEVGSDDPEPDDALFEALRAWRSRVASTNGVPAYLVFHDRHLQVLAGRKPSTLIELAGCPGVGPAKLERYGDDLLDLIADHLT
jgi:hypothetical protein